MMHSNVRGRILTGVLLLVLAAGSGSAQGKGPAGVFEGTWVLNPARSTYEGSQPSRGSTRTIDNERDGMILFTVQNQNATGNTGCIHYVTLLDGKDYEEAVRTRPNAPPTAVRHTVATRKVDDHTWELTLKDDGKVNSTMVFTVSDDGKTMTSRRKGTSPQGQPTSSVELFEKR